MSKSKPLLIGLTIALMLGLSGICTNASQVRGSRLVQTDGSWMAYFPVISRDRRDSFTFVSWSDTKAGTASLAVLSNQAMKLKPAFTLFPGDLESHGFTTRGIRDWTKAINGGWSNGMYDITFALRGNHDADNVRGWQSYFHATTTASQVGATRFSTLTEDLSYSFDYGNARFIGLDIVGGITQIHQADINYIDQQLTDAEKRGLTHAFLFFHGPIYSISTHTDCPTRTCPTLDIILSLVKMLNRHPIVSAVFNGHEHMMAYIHMDSSRIPEITHPFEEFITGSAGAELYNCDKPYRFDYCGSYDGFGAIRVDGRAFSVSIYKTGIKNPVKTWNFIKQ